jgi:hypothetical protein
MMINKRSKTSVLMLIIVLISVVGGAVFLAACDHRDRQNEIDEGQPENIDDGQANGEGNSAEDIGTIENGVFIKLESKDGFPKQYKEQFSNHIAELFTEKYSPYYQVLGFEFTNVEHVLTDIDIEVTFFLKMINQNYYKNPDTVEYIKEAKESGSKHYQQLYDEYNQPKESNYDMKFTAKLNDGDIEAGSIQLFTNVHPKGVEYVPIDKGFFPGD